MQGQLCLRSRRSLSLREGILCRSAHIAVDWHSTLKWKKRAARIGRANIGSHRLPNWLEKPTRKTARKTYTYIHVRIIYTHGEVVQEDRRGKGRERRVQRTFVQASWPRMESEMRSSGVQFGAECGDPVARNISTHPVYSCVLFISLSFRRGHCNFNYLHMAHSETRNRTRSAIPVQNGSWNFYHAIKIEIRPVPAILYFDRAIEDTRENIPTLTVEKFLLWYYARYMKLFEISLALWCGTPIAIDKIWNYSGNFFTNLLQFITNIKAKVSIQDEQVIGIF